MEINKADQRKTDAGVRLSTKRCERRFWEKPGCLANFHINQLAIGDENFQIFPSKSVWVP